MWLVTHPRFQNGHIDRRVRLWAVIALAAALLLGGRLSNAAGVTERASVSSAEVQGNDASTAPAISAGGRFVAFVSKASNLIAADATESEDIYVRDLQTGTTELVSKSSTGEQGLGPSFSPSISANGRFVAFRSQATNLVENDTNTCSPFFTLPGSCPDIFVHDRTTHTTTRVSVKSDGTQADDQSFLPTISANGTFIVFVSLATNLVGNDTNGVQDVFIHNRNSGITARVSIADNEAQGNGSSGDGFNGPGISADGRYVVFPSSASNLVTGDTNVNCTSGMMMVNCSDVFVRDRTAGTTTRISLGAGGAQGNGNSFGGSISSDGRYVAFRSVATNLVADDTNSAQDIFLYDRQTAALTRVSLTDDDQQADGPASAPFHLSANGSHVVFGSTAGNLVTGDTNTCPNQMGTPGPCPDIFVRNLQSNQTERVNLAADGTTQANGYSINPTISADGLVIAFESAATNLVAGDTNTCAANITPGSCPDIFVTKKVPANGGVVTLQGRTSGSSTGDQSIATVTVDGGTVLPVSSEGIFSLSGVSNGGHTLLACAPGYLCAQRMITISGGVVSGGLPAVILRGGKVDSDSDVDIADVTAIITAFGSHPAGAVDGQNRRVDVNGDGVVSLPDLSLTLGNFGRTSPQSWP